jgi:hypothetical protein
MHRLTFATLALVLAACTRATPDSGMTKEPTPPAPTSSSSAKAQAAPPAPLPSSGETDPRFADEAKQIFTTYKAWGRVDDEMRWAPWLCRMPMPARPHMSVADDGGHARKLYSLFAKDHLGYVTLSAPNPKAPAVGQVIVKESWVPELVKDKNAEDARGRFGAVDYDGADPALGGIGSIERDHFHRFAREGDKLYRASRIAGVYMMFKKSPQTPGTDAGWVYATLTPTGEVTSAGRVASCMGCHVSAKHERLFGSNATE